MVRRTLLLGLLAVLAGPLWSQTLASLAGTLEQTLVQPCRYEPFPRADSAGWRQTMPEAMRQSYTAAAEPLLGQPWPALPATEFAQFKENGNRVGYEALSFRKRQHLAILAMAEIIEGKGRFLPDIVNGLQSFCEETWWGIPAHYGSKVPRTEDQTVDLFNAETASLIVWTTYMLRPALDRFSPLLARRIDSEIGRRILEPARTGNYWWKTAGMNWNPWICSNWLYCVLLCEPDRQRQLEAVGQIMAATDAFINSYPDDGGCDEGPGYWDRAAASMFEVLFTLREATGGRIDLSSHPKVKAMGSYVYKTYIENDYCTTFADIHTNHAVVQPNTLYPFGRFLADETMNSFAAYAARRQDYTATAGKHFAASHNFPSMARELLFLNQLADFLNEKPAEPLLNDVWLPNLQIMTARRGPLYVAMKGGHNGESHNHNDVGSFIVYADGQPLFIDAGVGEYTSKTFSGDRYDIWTMQSGYHNLPQVNGTDQHDGKDYAARLISHKPGRLTLDLAGAYPPEAAVSAWLRTVAISRSGVTVTEDFTLSANKAPTRLMLLTTTKPAGQKPGQLSVGSHRLTYNPRQLSATVEDISDKLDPTLRSMWGDRLYRIVLTVSSPQTKQNISYRID